MINIKTRRYSWRVFIFVLQARLIGNKALRLKEHMDSRNRRIRDRTYDGVEGTEGVSPPLLIPDMPTFCGTLLLVKFILADIKHSFYTASI